MVKRVQNIPVMIDIDKRFEVMDRHEGYVQVLTLSAPPLENVAGTGPVAGTGQSWPTTRWPSSSIAIQIASLDSSPRCR